MYLVDTSTLIDAQKHEPVGTGILLRQLLLTGAPVGVTGIVIQEVVQGARDEFHLKRLRLWMASLPRYESAAPEQLPYEAARLYARCRWHGFTIRSSLDCLIACVAIEHRLTLIHDDGEYRQIAKVEPRLKLM